MILDIYGRRSFTLGVGLAAILFGCGQHSTASSQGAGVTGPDPATDSTQGVVRVADKPVVADTGRKDTVAVAPVAAKQIDYFTANLNGDSIP